MIYKKNDKQKTLHSFLISIEEKDVIDELRSQLNKITYSLATTNGWTQTDKALQLMNRIKELEENKK